MKVLSIGNECTPDIHSYLPFLAQAAGKKLLLADLYLENASVEDHYGNFMEENEVYTYETYLEGITESIKASDVALHEAVEDDDWDIITIQQTSALAGVKDSYTHFLPELAAYCKLMHPESEIMLIQPWTFENGYKSTDFFNYYNNDRDNMYNEILQAMHEASEDADIETVIPLGRAWKIARETNIGDKLTTDLYHANELGQFLSSCVLYQSVFGSPAGESPFILPEYNPAVTKLIKACADSAF